MVNNTEHKKINGSKKLSEDEITSISITIEDLKLKLNNRHILEILEENKKKRF